MIAFTQKFEEKNNNTIRVPKYETKPAIAHTIELVHLQTSSNEGTHRRIEYKMILLWLFLRSVCAFAIKKQS